MKINNINYTGSKKLVRQGLENKKQNINNTVLNSNINNNKINSTPAFKGLGGIDSFCLSLANLIENGGLFVSFTLQDMLGTNLPRPIMGLMRNSKENNGKTNTKFAAKELVREMLTGPSMFIIPMAMLKIGKPLAGNNIDVPMKFIQDFGDIHAKAQAKSVNKAISNEEFYTNTFAEMIKNAKNAKEIDSEILDEATKWAKELDTTITTANEGSKKIIKGILKGEISPKDTLKVKKANKEILGTIQEKINELSDKYTAIAKKAADTPVHADFTSVKLNNASGSFKESTAFMISYADDTLKKVKSHIKEEGTEKVADYIKTVVNKSTIKRMRTNAIMFAAVLGFLTIIPKLYNKAEGKGNAGLTGLMKEETLNSAAPKKTEEKKQTTKTDNTQQPSFKGGIASLAPKMTTGKLGKILGGLEFKGFNLSLPLLLGVMGLGVLTPRLIQAKDKYDREEIARRDLVTCAVMAFGEKILCKLFSKANEANSGMVLTQKSPDFAKQSLPKKVWDYIRPEKGVGILSSEKIIAKYSNIEDYKGGVVGFAESISREGGNLSKIFGGKISEEAKNIVENTLGKGENISSADNQTIIEGLKKLTKEDKDALEALFKQEKRAVKKLDFKQIKENGHIFQSFKKALTGESALPVKEVKKVFDNPWVTKAKKLNARFTALSVLVLVPVFLGFMLPAINERATKKRIREEQAAEETQKTANTNTTTNTNTNVNENANTTTSTQVQNNKYAPKVPSVFADIHHRA